MRQIKRTFFMNATLKDVWKALVDPRLLSAWGAGPAEMSARKGAAFSLWGGDIYGKNTDVVKEKKLVQEWYAKGWKVPSKVTITIKLEKLRTRIDLKHEKVPTKEYGKFLAGWKDSYFGPMKQYLEEEYAHPEFEHHQGG